MLLRAALALVLAAITACSSAHSTPGDAGQDARVDARADAARADARRDTGIDARPDAHVDAGTDARADARADGGAGLDADWLGCDPGWTPMPGIDADLELYYATNPSCLLPIAWESCGTGCQRLVDDSRFQRAMGEGWSDGGRHLFSLVEGNAALRTLDAEIITVIASADGEVRGAWRGSASGDRSRNARVGSVGGGNGWVGMQMPAHRFTAEGNFATYDERLYHAPLDALSRPLDPVLRLAPPVVSVEDTAQFVVASDTTLAAEVQPRGQVLVLEHGVAHWLGGPGSATPATPQQVMVQGRDVYWLDFFESYPGVRLAHGSWSTESEVFYDIPGVDLVGFATDGHDFAWVQGYDYGAGGYSHMELWTAPYTNDKSALAPRKVSDFVSTPRGEIGAGMYATGYFSGSTYVIRLHSLADGSKRDWRVPVGMAIDGGALWVTADEVAFPGRMSIRGQRTIIRLSIADAFTPVP
ncbi:MAG: hypothetical protein GXP55_17225 [Deltaproteobacteria bacterium]|nr:hypothetical protein [Deltaproteobacteria bacterium]